MLKRLRRAVAASWASSGPSRTPFWFGPTVKNPSSARVLTMRYTVERGRPTTRPSSARLSPDGASFTARRMVATRLMTWTPVDDVDTPSLRSATGQPYHFVVGSCARGHLIHRD